MTARVRALVDSSKVSQTARPVTSRPRLIASESYQLVSVATNVS
jgi:hypothetical protein